MRRASSPNERETRRGRFEPLHVERDQLDRAPAEDVRLRVLLGLRPVLERAPVLRRVLLRDLRRELLVRTAHDVDGRVAVHGEVLGLHSERKPWVARKVLRPARLLAALEVENVVDPYRPRLDEVRLAIVA